MRMIFFYFMGLLLEKSLKSVVVLSNAQRQVHCFDQSFKWFARHLAWGWQPIVFTKFKAEFDCWRFNHCIYSLFAHLACTHLLHVGGDREITSKHRKSWGAM